MSVILRLMSKPHNQARRLGAGSKKQNKKWKSGATIDLRMYIRTWPAATSKHLYVQVNANKYDSGLPHAQDERNLAFNEQTTQPGTPIGC